MKKTITCIAIITALVVGFCGGKYGCSRSSPSTSAYDTIIFRDTIVDTINYRLPLPVESLILRYETVKLPVLDSTYLDRVDVGINTDSVFVEVPITQKEYHDSTYSAWVSGYKVSLDSINIYQKSIIETYRIRDPPKRWGLGIQVGAGYCNDNKIKPYIGLGISYNILTW